MDPIKKKKLLSGLWEIFQAFILSLLHDVVLKKALKIFLKGATGSVWQVKLVTLIAEEFYEELGKPVANALLVETGYQYDRYQGKAMIKKLKGATNGQAYNDAADDIMS